MVWGGWVGEEMEGEEMEEEEECPSASSTGPATYSPKERERSKVGGWV